MIPLPTRARAGKGWPTQTRAWASTIRLASQNISLKGNTSYLSNSNDAVDEYHFTKACTHFFIGLAIGEVCQLSQDAEDMSNDAEDMNNDAEDMSNCVECITE